jgi:hypothetical protein
MRAPKGADFAAFFYGAGVSDKENALTGGEK